MNIFYADCDSNKVFDEGFIALAKLPKLENLTIEKFDKNISDETFKHFTSLKSLELSLFEDLSNETLICIASNCLELRSLTIDGRKSLIVKIYLFLIAFN